MRTITRLLFLLHIFSHVEADHVDLSTGIRWFEPQRSAWMRLESPELPFWSHDEQVGLDLPSAFIFNITLTTDNRTLLLNSVPILPVEDAYKPPVLHAYQTGVCPYYGARPDCLYGTLFTLDYARIVPDREDVVVYTHYQPTLNIDILGASIGRSIGSYNALLRSDKQRFISIQLRQREQTTLPISELSYQILDIELVDTFRHFKERDALKRCSKWSWRCADIERWPWYQYIYGEQFDEFGKIGSLRHAVYKKCAALVERLGWWPVVSTAAVVCCAMLAAAGYVVGYGVYLLYISIITFFRRRQEEVDLWLADEEIESLLGDDEAGDKLLDHLPKISLEMKKVA